ncbi:x-pro dipeptidyl-peptidase c-terminal non-catalytic domain-containing protein [Fusarium coicis]|nr:x-pro dipeptidyl-peptidase c-terminal non-catalytic domain-containing protein [Fusarium coicis]
MEALKARFPDLAFCPLRKPTGFDPATIHLPVGHVKAEGRRPFTVESVFARDVEVLMRDGIKIYSDVFRPASSSDPGGQVPAIIAWSPYGKDSSMPFISHIHADYKQLIDTEGHSYDHMGPFRCGLKLDQTSGYEKFEAPDPADWCARGYAVINPDARGAGFSEGDIAQWGDQEAFDLHDLIDWVSKQPWCNGCVGTAGNSWLAIAQINVAARNPHPALKAIAPWEAATDGYNDFMARGGIPRSGFMRMLYQTMTGKRGAEDGGAMVEKRPLFDEYWATKVIPVENIDLPMYLTASYSTCLHSRGSFETFAKAKSTQKWLRVHHTQEWYDIYRKKNNDELQKFFDRYCKGISNDWEQTPRLRLSLLGFDGSPAKTIVERAEAAFPVPGTEYRKFFLDAATLSLSLEKPAAESNTSYEAHHMTDCTDFSVRFHEYTEVSGYPVVKLWMSCDEHDDMDVNIQIRKIDANGKLLTSLNYPCPVPAEEVANTNVAKFLGCDGMLRASHRVSKEIVDGLPTYKHNRLEKIPPGTIIDLEIPLWPIGMVFESGEGIVLRAAGHELRLPELEVLQNKKPTDDNIGRHQIHTGKQWDSYLLLPVIASCN